MNKITACFTIFILLGLTLMFGCGQSKPVADTSVGATGSVQVSINWPLAGKARAASIPTTAASIIITASGDDMTPVSAEVTYPQTVGTLEVKVGSNRVISATAKTSSGVVVATGEVSGVTVSLGTNSPVSISLSPLAGRNYFPSQPGNTLAYKYSNGDSLVTTFEGEEIVSGSITAQLTKSYYVFSGQPYTSEAYYDVTDSGVYYYGSPQYPTTEAQEVLRFPLSIGETWIQWSSGQYSIAGSIISQESIAVTAGIFDCYKVKYSNYTGTVETSSYYIWFGNGAGIVKIDTEPSSVAIELQSKNF
jgi:hypothetical protein